jgi:hypothetical protein
MADRVAAKVGTYEKDGQTKGDYARLGVQLHNDNGAYLLLDPTINLAGVLIKQNAMARAEGKQERDMVMVSIFTDKPKGESPQQSAPSQDFQPDSSIPF